MADNNEPNIEQRLLIAVLVSLAILFSTQYLYQVYFPPPEAPPAVEQEEAPQEASASSESGPATEPSPAVSQEQAEAPPEPPVQSAPGLPPTEATARTVEIETSDLILRINTAGGIIESVRLKEYLTEAGRPLELLPQTAPLSAGRLLQVRFGDLALDERLATAPYELTRGGSAGLVEMLYRDQDVTVRKVLEIPEQGYDLGLRIEVERSGRPSPYRLVLGPGIGGGQAGTENDFTWQQVVYYADGGATRYDSGDLEGAETLPVSPRWLAVDSQYFAYVLFAPGLIREFTMQQASWVPPAGEGEEEAAEVVQVYAIATLPAATEGILFMGPKADEILSRVGPSLDDLIDYGWFAFFVKPLIFLLKGINDYVGNYGWSIIILTFLINLVLVPVRYKQTVSMRKMSELQPKIRSIQDKYKRLKRDDPKRQQMNVEMMALYKEHGVNPLGGCLPLLLQMPILFAFYSMLQVVIELRGAPFILWINDLSKPDPYLITPIVMGATMVAQQKMTPSTADPAQKRMMMIMPVVFTFMFLYVSSGLALYFLFSNVFAMMFQFLLQQFKPELAPAKSGSKKSGKKKKK